MNLVWFSCSEDLKVLLTFPAILADWCNKSCLICAIKYVIRYVKYPQIFVMQVGHGVLTAGFYLSLYCLYILNRNINPWFPVAAVAIVKYSIHV